jgi:hypothetical protein
MYARHAHACRNWLAAFSVLQHQGEVHLAVMTNTPVKEDENIWRRRLAERLAGLRSMKATPEYVACRLRATTPDPFDRTLSKRRWKRGVQEFHQAVRDQSPQSLMDWSGNAALEEPRTPIPSFLCGRWIDQRGSFYKLLPGREGAFHVETTRPCGRMRFTRNLICIILVRGREEIFWRRCRYKLERFGSEVLLWHGFSDRDIFSWRRVVTDVG